MLDETQNNPESNQPVEGEVVNESTPALDENRDLMGDRLANLDVAQVEASAELEQLRNQNASQVQNHTQVIEEEPNVSDAFADESSGLMDLLKEANLSPRHLRFCCGGIVVLGLFVLIGWGGVKWISSWGDEKPEVDVVEETPVEEKVVVDEEELVVEAPFQTVDDELMYTDGTVYSALLLGNYEPVQDGAVDASELLGEELVSQDSLAQSISLFAEMYEAMQVDVRILLNQSSDRRDTLHDYRNQLRYFVSKATDEMAALTVMTDNLSRQFNEVETDKELFEERFFDDLADLDAYGATANLNEFIVRGERVVSIRAQYLARLKLLEYYEMVLEAMELRVTDLTVNEEAIVKGVQVVDVLGSDLNLVIQEDEL